MFSAKKKQVFNLIFQYFEPETGWYENYYSDGNKYIVFSPDFGKEKIKIISEKEFINKKNKYKEKYQELKTNKYIDSYPDCCWIEPKQHNRKQK